MQAIDNITLAPNFPPSQLHSNDKLSAAIFRINETVQVCNINYTKYCQCWKKIISLKSFTHTRTLLLSSSFTWLFHANCKKLNQSLWKKLVDNFQDNKNNLPIYESKFNVLTLCFYWIFVWYHDLLNVCILLFIEDFFLTAFFSIWV